MLHSFQDVVFWIVIHKDEVIFDAGAIALFGMSMIVLTFYESKH